MKNKTENTFHKADSDNKKKNSISIYLPNKVVKTFDKNPTVLEVAESLSVKLRNQVVAGKVETMVRSGGNLDILSNNIIDVRTKLEDGEKIEFIQLEDEEALEVIRHTTSHVMAQAVQTLWPEAKVCIGPVIENGFYYDFDVSFNFTEEHLSIIEKKMSEIIQTKAVLKKSIWVKDKAIEYFRKKGELYKVEIIEDLEEGKEVSVYEQGDWLDLCKGPHLLHLGQIRAFKLLSFSGSYWKGDEKNVKLQRIYGTAFQTKKELKKYLNQLEELKKRDHRKLGKDLKLFYFHSLSPAHPFFTPKGTVIYNELKKFIQELYKKYGYQEVITPQLFDIKFYKQSGHYENYLENIYPINIEEKELALKPMNCPGHCLLYKMERRSYRDLPWRVADFGRLHRMERSGVAHGLTRVKSFVQDDAHVFCRAEDVPNEIEFFVQFLQEVYEKLDFLNYKVYLSTRPKKRMGDEKAWDQAEKFLEQSLRDLNLTYEVLPEEGAFYGPKLDVFVKDSLSRMWQLGTLQYDFNLPKAFNLKYVSEKNEEDTPILLHRAILGSFERFMGVYLEHTGGKLPLWLSPVQIAILTLTDRNIPYAKEVKEKLDQLGVRCFLDKRKEKLGFKIRNAQTQKIPYMLIIGDKEGENRSLSIRLRSGKTLTFSLCAFIEEISLEISERKKINSWEKTIK